MIDDRQYVQEEATETARTLRIVQPCRVVRRKMRHERRIRSSPPCRHKLILAYSLRQCLLPDVSLQAGESDLNADIEEDFAH